jgi:RNA polymerase sigma-70 factor (ECF subfamily)
MESSAPFGAERGAGVANPSFDDLMARLGAGDEAAAAEVFHRFAVRLRGLARKRLDRLLRAKVDAEDVLQSVYRSFFRRHAEGEYELGSWDSLWGLLTVITLRKCGRRARYFRSARRDAGREVELPPRPADASRADFEAIARDPTPSEAARLAETLEQVMRDLTERERAILALSLQGYTTFEVSEQVGRTERTVQRVLQRVRRRLEEMNAEHGPDA